jgi:triphosphoribosyl-dephospho-CoA synthetase
LRREIHNSACFGSERVHERAITFALLIAHLTCSARSERKKLMIGKATVFAIVMLAPGLAFAAASAATESKPAVTAQEKADSSTAVKADTKSTTADTKTAKTVKTAKAKTHKAKVLPDTEKKTDSKS